MGNNMKTFKHVKAVLGHLLGQGYQVTQPTLYRHAKAGKLVASADGTYTEAAVTGYAQTFLEKVALVHSYIERGKFSGDRFSRHLYDLYCIAESDHFEEIVKHRFLLKKIIDHREVFYRQPTANYQKILSGGLNLVPQGELLDSVKADYKKMDIMIYGQSPELGDILNSLSTIQRHINNN